MPPVVLILGGAVAVAAVPALRRRVVPVATAVTGGAVGVAGSVLKGTVGVAGATAGAVGNVAKAAWHGRAERAEDPSEPED